MRTKKVKLDVEKIRKLLNDSGRTAADLSRALGFTGTYINSVLGRGDILDVRIPAISRELNCRPEDIILREEKADEPVLADKPDELAEMEELKKKIDQMQADLDGIYRMILFCRWVCKNVALANGWCEDGRNA